MLRRGLLKYNRLLRFMRREYIKRRYWFDINNLHVPRNIKYSYSASGAYPTLFSAPNKHYYKRVKNNHYDAEGIILYQYREELYYNAIQIAQQGLEGYGYFKATQDKKYLEKLQIITDWFLDHQDVDKGVWFLDFDFQHPRIGMIKKHWVSSLAQGQAISLLCRMYGLTKEKKYLESAILAEKVMEIDVKDGGVFLEGNDFCWLEEYPTNPPSYTLNGFIYSIFGIYDLYQFTGDKKYWTFFERFVKSLEKVLPLYDSEGLTYYDLCHITNPVQNPCSNSKYHVLHVILLKNLVSIYPSKTLEFYASKWDKY